LNEFGVLVLGGRPRGSARPARLGFLGSSPFRGERPHFEGWILLDFLGFSSQNLDLSMGYAGKASNVFFEAVFAVAPISVDGKIHGLTCKRVNLSSNNLNQLSDFLQ
jgi:hypothetical protein